LGHLSWTYAIIALSCHDHFHDFALGISLCGRDGLCVSVKRDLAVCVPQQFLDRLYIFAVGLE